MERVGTCAEPAPIGAKINPLTLSAKLRQTKKEKLMGASASIRVALARMSTAVACAGETGFFFFRCYRTEWAGPATGTEASCFLCVNSNYSLVNLP